MRICRMVLGAIVLFLAFSSESMGFCGDQIHASGTTRLGLNAIGGSWIEMMRSYEVIGSFVASELLMTSGSQRRIKYRYLRATTEIYD